MELYFNDKTYKIDSYVYESYIINEDDKQNTSSNTQQHTNNQSKIQQNQSNLPEKNKLEQDATKLFASETLTKQYIDRIKHKSKTNNSSNIDNINYQKILENLNQLNTLLDSAFKNILMKTKELKLQQK